MASCMSCAFFGEADGYCRKVTHYVSALNPACKEFITCEDFEKEMKNYKTEKMKEKTVTEPGAETAVCSVCGETKSLDKMHRNRWGTTKTCTACYRRQCRLTIAKKKAPELPPQEGGEPKPKQAVLKAKKPSSASAKASEKPAETKQKVYEKPACACHDAPPYSLAGFSTRELVNELSRRGYSGCVEKRLVV